MGLAFLTVVFFCLKFYARAARREKLEKQWEEQGKHGDRAAFVANGMAAYEKPLKRNLVFWVYIIPTLIAAVTVFLTNMD
ncbi:MAG: hypothetical protein AAGF53_03365 [Pseudomonadota bacterium]